MGRLILCLILFISPLAQAKCENWLTVKTAYQKAARVFAIISLATMPVQSSIPTMPASAVTATAEPSVPWKAEDIDHLVKREYDKRVRYVQYLKSQTNPDLNLIEEIELDLEALRAQFPYLGA